MVAVKRRKQRTQSLLVTSLSLLFAISLFFVVVSCDRPTENNAQLADNHSERVPHSEAVSQNEEGSLAVDPDQAETLRGSAEGEAAEREYAKDVEDYWHGQESGHAPFREEFRQYAQWIVKWKPGYPRPEEDGFKIVDVDAKRLRLLIELDQKTRERIEEWYAEWTEREDVEYIEPNREMKINRQSHAVLPQDSDAQQAGEFLDVIQAEEGWKIENSNEEMTIAILDTGIDLDHPALKDNLVPGVNILDKSKSADDDVGHGTQVAGVLAAHGEGPSSVRGVLHRAKIMPVKVMEDGVGRGYEVAQGIYYAVDHGARIVLLSLGEPTYSQDIHEAIDYAEEHGVLVIAATGNRVLNFGNIDTRVHYPAAFPTVLGVGAVDEHGERAEYANYGTEVSVVAPGTVRTTTMGGGETILSGTSFAAPQVAGLAALILKKYPGMTPAQVRKHIIYTSDDVFEEGWDIHTGHGRINVAKALETEPVADIYEDHDAADNAAPFPAETVVNAELRNKDDTDWYYIQAPYRGKVHLEVDLDIGKYEGVDIICYPEGEEDEARTYTVQKSGEIELDIIEKTVIQIRFNENERRTTPVGYEITNTFTIYDDAQHPNHTREMATELTGNGQVYTGTLNRDEDEDWFVFNAEEKGVLRFWLDVDTIRLDPVVHIERPDGTSEEIGFGYWASDSDDYRTEMTWQAEEGVYYFRVRDFSRLKVNGEYYLSLVFQAYE